MVTATALREVNELNARKNVQKQEKERKNGKLSGYNK